MHMSLTGSMRGVVYGMSLVGRYASLRVDGVGGDLIRFFYPVAF
jgi:hypothetical protein